MSSVNSLFINNETLQVTSKQCMERVTTVTLVTLPKLLWRVGVSKRRAFLQDTKRNKTISPMLIVSRPVPCISQLILQIDVDVISVIM